MVVVYIKSSVYIKPHDIPYFVKVIYLQIENRVYDQNVTLKKFNTIKLLKVGTLKLNFITQTR